MARAAGSKPVRRDTHDRALSEDVLALVPHVLARAPHVKCVFLERLPGTLGAATDRAQFARDFEHLTELVHAAPKPVVRATALPEGFDMLDKLIDDDAEQLGALQNAMLDTLLHAPDVESVRQSLVGRP